MVGDSVGEWWETRWGGLSPDPYTHLHHRVANAGACGALRVAAASAKPPRLAKRPLDSDVIPSRGSSLHLLRTGSRPLISLRTEAQTVRNRNEISHH
jgi:hypothetical protein